MAPPRIGDEEIAGLERFHSDGAIIDDGKRLYVAGDYCGDCRTYRPCAVRKLLTERREREAKLAKVGELVKMERICPFPCLCLDHRFARSVREALAGKGTPPHE